MTRRLYSANVSRVAVATVMIASASPVFAQQVETSGPANQLQEIIVTAERREASLQKTPVSVATVSGEEIDRTGLKSLDEVARNLPNVVISSSAIGFSATIRGVGTSPIPADIGGSAGVSNLYDGIYSLQEQAARTGFYDVARFEVLRGPQGTLYGRNAEGGVFNVVTNNPTQTMEGSGGLEVGNYNLARLSAMINVPVSDTLAVRLAATHIDRDGYLSNGQDDNVATGVRLKVLYRPSDAVEVLVAGEYTHASGEGMGTVSSFTYPLADPWTSPNPTGQSAKNDAYKIHGSLKFDLGLGDLTLIPAYQHSGEEAHVQYTGAYNNIGSNPQDLDQRSLEARLTSKPESKIGWVTGIYLYGYDQVAVGQDTTLSNGVIIADPTQPYKTTTQTAKAAAAFLQLIVPLSERVRVIGGARQSRDDYSIHTTVPTPGGPADFYPLTKGKWTHFDWKAGVEYDVADDAMIYATAASGYRPGGFDPLPTGGFDLESLVSYEIGSKNEFLDHRLRLNGSAFYYDYSNYQVVTFVPGGPFGAQPMVLNAKSATMYGAEVEATWLASPRDTLTASLGLLHSEVKSPVSVTDPDGASPVALVGIQGTTFMNAPKTTAHVSYRRRFFFASGAEISAGPSIHYSSSYHITPATGRTSNQGSYVKYDGEVSFTSASRAWTLTVYGRNLGNEAVKSAYLPAGNLLLQSPRTYGAAINRKF